MDISIACVLYIVGQLANLACFDPLFHLLNGGIMLFFCVDATVSDHKLFVAVEKGFVDQVCPSGGLVGVLRLLGSGRVRAFVEAYVAAVDDRVIGESEKFMGIVRMLG